jgi:hypothetical protein
MSRKGGTMHKVTLTASLVLAMAVSASASKIIGSTTLKDSQPVGTIDKDAKYQAYDLFFQSAGQQYTCRTNPKKPINTTDFVIGSDIQYEIDENRATIRTPKGKKVDCKIVRVEYPGST